MRDWLLEAAERWEERQRRAHWRDVGWLVLSGLAVGACLWALFG